MAASPFQTIKENVRINTSRTYPTPKEKTFPTKFPFLVENKTVKVVILAVEDGGRDAKYGRLVKGIVLQSNGHQTVGRFNDSWILGHCVPFEGKLTVEFENG